MNLNKIVKRYAEIFIGFTFYIRTDEKTNYSPSSETICFKSSTLMDQRLIEIQDFETQPVAEKFGRYKVNIYLHPILICYGNKTHDQNPTIERYFKTYPTNTEILKLIGKQVSTFLKEN